LILKFNVSFFSAFRTLLHNVCGVGGVGGVGVATVPTDLDAGVTNVAAAAAALLCCCGCDGGG
jgi:hypothetical protein